MFLNLPITLCFYTLSIRLSYGTEVAKSCVQENRFVLKCNRIPYKIPGGILEVHISDAVSPGNVVQLNSTAFSTFNWSSIKYLELSDNKADGCVMWIFEQNSLSGLRSLKELHLHLSCIHLSPDTFVHLGSLHTLDLSGCKNLTIYELIPALNGSNKLPALRKIILSDWNLYEPQYSLDNTFVNVLLPRQITHINVSNSQIAHVNLSAIILQLKHLETLNLSYTNIDRFFIDGSVVDKNGIKHIKMLDYTNCIAQNMHVPVSHGILSISDVTFRSKYVHLLVRFLMSQETINVSRIVPHETSIRLENVTYICAEDLIFLTKNFIARQNNLRRLDVELVCPTFSTFQEIDISDNGLEYIHPTVFSTASNLSKIVLSNNKLYKMVKENRTLSENLFAGLKHLKFISLSDNSLHDIPRYIFIDNNQLVTIDLSNNKLDQVTFDLNGLEHLKCIILRNNNIKILNQYSMDQLNFLKTENKNVTEKVQVVLASNPFSCSVCKAKISIKWLLSTTLVDATYQNLTCENEDDKLEGITEKTLNNIKSICNRKRMTISAGISAGFCIIILLGITAVFYRRRKRALRQNHRDRVIERIRTGEGQYEFAVFLSYSNGDEGFVRNSVWKQLDENLRLITGVDRELVSTGDRHFRPGFYVHNETMAILERVSVVIFVVSTNFCSSEYCRNELEQAYVSRRPIILMFIELVNPELMLPILRELYLRNARIIWRNNNGERILTTTWENICNSILDIIVYTRNT